MSKERISVKDSLSIVLRKADGTVITPNFPKITEEFLNKILEEKENESRQS